MCMRCAEVARAAHASYDRKLERLSQERDALVKANMEVRTALLEASSWSDGHMPST